MIKEDDTSHERYAQSVESKRQLLGHVFTSYSKEKGGLHVVASTVVPMPASFKEKTEVHIGTETLPLSSLMISNHYESQYKGDIHKILFLK